MVEINHLGRMVVALPNHAVVVNSTQKGLLSGYFNNNCLTHRVYLRQLIGMSQISCFAGICGKANKK